MYYSIGKKLMKIVEGSDVPQPFIAVLQSDEFNGGHLPPGFSGQDLPRYPKPRFCKAEVHEDMLSGTLSIPEKKTFGKHSGFSYYIRNNGVLFADDFRPSLLPSVEKVREVSNMACPFCRPFFLYFHGDTCRR